jgi:cytochrome o ubiquinol oxidase operon protein cyoD
VSKKSHNDSLPGRKQEKHRGFRFHVYDIGLALLLITVPIGLKHWISTTSRASLPGEQTSSYDEMFQRKHEERQEFRSYVWGIALALVLTAVPFALVHWFFNISRLWLLIVIGAFALVQILVHFRFFLHIGLKQKREDLQLLLFSGLLLTFMVAGTIWIMASLAQRMAMPVSF